MKDEPRLISLPSELLTHVQFQDKKSETLTILLKNKQMGAPEGSVG